MNTHILDITNLRGKALNGLLDNLLNQCLVLHLFPGYHDSMSDKYQNERISIKQQLKYSPNNCRLDDIFTFLIYCLEDVGKFSLHLGLDRMVKVNTNLL